MKRPSGFLPKAAGDIREIWEYIEEDSLRAARKVRLLILDAVPI
jgi:plasmid stabilization system protein ParE